MSRINPFSRYQRGLVISDVFPDRGGYCACGCGKELIGRQRRWASKECERAALTTFLIIKGDIETIRAELYRRDRGVCNHCGSRRHWHADHIFPVHKGGGACTLDNFNTLCVSCHNKKTYQAFESVSEAVGSEILSHHNTQDQS